MSDLLSKWIGLYRSELEGAGFSVTLKGQHVGGALSADLDGPSVLGAITHWPEEQFEFQFNSRETGEVLVLEERRFSNVEDLNAFFLKSFGKTSSFRGKNRANSNFVQILWTFQ